MESKRMITNNNTGKKQMSTKMQKTVEYCTKANYRTAAQ